MTPAYDVVHRAAYTDTSPLSATCGLGGSRSGFRDDQGTDIGSATTVDRTLPRAVGRWCSRWAFGVPQELIRGDLQADLGLR